MQRQSLGSPASKLNIHGSKSDTTTLSATDTKRQGLPSTSLTDTDDDDDLNRKKAVKPRRFSSPSSSLSSSSPLSLSVLPSNPEKLIHLIPLLTLLCFLVLYLVSHNPSQSDLAHFNGFKQSSTHIDEIGDVGRYTEAGRGGDGVLVVRSLRNLQEIADKRKSRSHRKIARFF